MEQARQETTWTTRLLVRLKLARQIWTITVRFSKEHTTSMKKTTICMTLAVWTFLLFFTKPASDAQTWSTQISPAPLQGTSPWFHAPLHLDIADERPVVHDCRDVQQPPRYVQVLPVALSGAASATGIGTQQSADGIQQNYLRKCQQKHRTFKAVTTKNPRQEELICRLLQRMT